MSERPGPLDHLLPENQGRDALSKVQSIDSDTPPYTERELSAHVREINRRRPSRFLKTRFGKVVTGGMAIALSWLGYGIADKAINGPNAEEQLNNRPTATSTAEPGIEANENVEVSEQIPVLFIPGTTSIDLSKATIRKSPNNLNEQYNYNAIDLSKIAEIEGVAMPKRQGADNLYMEVENLKLEDGFVGSAPSKWGFLEATLIDNSKIKIDINYQHLKEQGVVVSEGTFGFIEKDSKGGYYGEIPRYDQKQKRQLSPTIIHPNNMNHVSFRRTSMPRTASK
ncbi:MAG: hypothetical protein M1365_01345 [Actinobacteria bacterium]|nr:hypothetical protein [Actinomycetota bacterium]